MTIKQLARALAEMKPENRALLDLSLRRGLPDEDIAKVLRASPGEVADRRAALITKLEEDLGLDTRDARDELRATLPDLPPEAWNGRG